MTAADDAIREELKKEDFEPSGFGDEVRVDTLCLKLLRSYYDALIAGGLDPATATVWANGAEYFVRDFVIDKKMRSIFAEVPGTVRQFGGNWYIVNTLEPNAAELTGMLQGIKGFYRFLHDGGLISDDYLAALGAECDDIGFYQRRIAAFWEITGDGYLEWERECSLQEQPEVNKG